MKKRFNYEPDNLATLLNEIKERLYYKMDKLLEMAANIGLKGNEAIDFIREQQEIERNERMEERERQREEQERQREERERERAHEIELARLRQENNERRQVDGKKSVKLPTFVDEKDDLDSYLQRFERFARGNSWPEEEWAVSLSALLSGRALDVYSRLPDEVANDYPQLKQALLKRYNLTEEGYREKFRRCSPEKDESPEQFIFRISTYLNQWLKFSNSEQTYQGIKNLIVKEQFINSCPQYLSIYLQERAPSTIEELSKLSEKYLIAHKRTY